jgi:natural product precursor
MKTKKLSKSLTLKKETVVNLSNNEMTAVLGGVGTMGFKCITQVVSCDSSTCYDTGLLYGCTTSIPGLC